MKGVGYGREEARPSYKISSPAVARVAKIEYFQPKRTMAQANEIAPAIDRILTDYVNSLMDYNARIGKKIVVWKEANGDILEEAKWGVRNSGRQSVLHDAWGISWKRANEAARVLGGNYGALYGKENNSTDRISIDPASDAAFYAAAYAEWEQLKDIEQFAVNPAEHMIKLYEMGLKPTFFRKIEGDPIEKFTVDIPLEGGNLGCYAHTDGEVVFQHGWGDYCANLIAVKAADDLPKKRKFV